QAFSNLNQPTTTWTYINGALASALASDKHYTIQSKAYNAANVVESVLNAPTTFYYDVTRPTTSITTPSATGFTNLLDEIDGGSYDQTACVAAGGVAIAIWDKTANKWWTSNTNDFTATSKTFNIQDIGPNNPWAFTTDDSKFLDGHFILVQSSAVDQA